MSKSLTLSKTPIPHRAIVLDTETTGFTPKQAHRIVEIGAIEIIDGIPSGREFHSYINPQRSIPPEALRVHGLTPDFLRDKPLFADILPDLCAFLTDNPQIPIWAHNAAFDKRFVEAEFDWANADLVHDFTCSMKLAKRLPHGASDNKLATLAEIAGYTWGPKGAHSAIEDTRALGTVLTRLLWPLEVIEAGKPNQGKKSAARKSPKDRRNTAKAALPEGFTPLTGEEDSRIRRYDAASLEDRLHGAGTRWTPQEETDLVSAFLKERSSVEDLIIRHGRTPAALLLKLEALGVIASGHPYTRAQK